MTGTPDTSEISRIAAQLLAERAACLPFPEAPGVYAYFLQPGTKPLPLGTSILQPGPNGLLYVGTSANLKARDHLAHAHSGFSTLRRSLGALLREELHLVAAPRTCGPSAINRRNYRFTSKGEQLLTAWMRQHLAHASCTLPLPQATTIEANLIRHLCPPLNLKLWTNPQAAGIKAQRARCVVEATEHGAHPEGDCTSAR